MKFFCVAQSEPPGRLKILTHCSVHLKTGLANLVLPSQLPHGILISPYSGVLLALDVVILPGAKAGVSERASDQASLLGCHFHDVRGAGMPKHLPGEVLAGAGLDRRFNTVGNIEPA